MAKTRKKTTRRKPAAKRVSRPRATAKGPHGSIPEVWRKRFELIPGYCPIKTAPDGHYFDAESADRAVGFFPRHLHHIQGLKAGQPYELMEWKKAIVGCVFGWKRPDGTRRYRTVFEYVPKKNDKTTMTAGLVLYLLCCDGELGAEIFSVAYIKDQAAKVFRTAAAMTRKDAHLKQALTVYGETGGSNQRSIHYGDSFYRPISLDAPAADGANPHSAIVDELHRHDDGGATLDILERGVSARRQPLIWIMTTADYDRDSICNRTLKRAKRVRDNGGDPKREGYDPEFLPIIFETPSDADWTDQEVWKAANPGLGESKSWDYMLREYRKATEDPVARNNFQRFDLNMLTQQIESLINMEHWSKCPKAIDRTSLKGRRCFAGIDLGERDDLASLALVFPPDDIRTGVWSVLWYTWCCETTIRKRQASAYPYGVWRDEGYLIETPGDDIDFDWIEKATVAAADEFNLECVGYDPRLATQLSQDLWNKHGIQVEPVRQGYETLTEPTVELVKAVDTHRLNHGGDLVAEWAAKNAVAEKNLSGHVRPCKGKSKDKIDPIMALVIAMCVALKALSKGEAEYEAGGMIL